MSTTAPSRSGLPVLWLACLAIDDEPRRRSGEARARPLSARTGRFSSAVASPAQLRKAVASAGGGPGPVTAGIRHQDGPRSWLVRPSLVPLPSGGGPQGHVEQPKVREV